MVVRVFCLFFDDLQPLNRYQQDYSLLEGSKQHLIDQIESEGFTIVSVAEVLQQHELGNRLLITFYCREEGIVVKA